LTTSTNPSHALTLPTAAQVVQPAIHSAMSHNPETTTKSPKEIAKDEITPSDDGSGLAKIPSLDDYLRYIALLQNNWRDAPHIDIVFNNLTYTIPISPDEISIPNIGKSFVNFFKFITFQLPPKIPLHVYHECSGTIPSGKMTLVLAPPGAGKSQFLKTLAGRMRNEKRVTGDLWYNGLTADEQLRAGQYVEKLCALVAQGDVHMANLTVRETLNFSLESSVADPKLLENPNPQLLAMHKRKVDLLLSVLGMHECAETIAGNAVIRGVSGGQKKRLTIGEFMITNARVLLLDEPTTGLDAAVARDIMVVLKQWCEMSGSTVIAALLQPTPECYELYDNVILMREGHIVYQGPRDKINSFLWQYHGIEVDPDQDIADFLVDWLTDPKLIYSRQRRRWAKRGGPTKIAGVDNEGELDKQTAPASHHVELTPVHKYRPEEEEKQSAQTVDGNYTVKLDGTNDHTNGNYTVNIDANGINTTNGQPIANGRRTPSHHTYDEAEIPSSIALPKTATIRVTNEQLVEAYRASSFYADQQVMIAQVQRSRQEGNNLEAVKNQAANASLYTREQYSRLYARPFLSHTMFSLKRQFTLMSRDKQTIPPRLFSSILIAVILGSLFLRLSPGQFYNKFGMILFALLNSAMGNFTELPAAFEGRNAVYKHLDAGMYPTLSYMVSIVIGFIPVMLAETILFSVILYFMVGLAEDAGRYFFFFLVLFITDFMLAALYRSVCYVTATIDQGQQVLNPVFNFMILFGGFLITRSKIPDFLIEFYWLTPISWALRSLVQNEFYAPLYGGNGATYLEAFEVQTDRAWQWAGVGYILGFFLVCILASAYLLKTVRFDLLQGTKRKKDDLPLIAANSPPVTKSLQTIEIPNPALGGARPKSSSRIINNSFSLPFTPLSLAFHDLHYTVKVKNSEGATVDRKLLNGISGYVKPGQLTALMGASGAGKTTLMDVIAGRKTAGKIEGQILVNGLPQNPAVYKRISGYCEQQDLHMPLATVRESLAFSAYLRLPTTVSEETREAFVDEILDLLELTPVKDRIIGNEAYVGLSPGQLKLVTIGVELVANPSILFLDEPTSGLDSRAALLVMRVVKNIAATGRTVLCTIHQPSSEVFYLFDYLLLLKSGGETVYFGPLGDDGKDIVEYFENDGIVGNNSAAAKKRPDAPVRPPTMNPASWMLDVIGAGVAGALSRAQAKDNVGDDSASSSLEYASLYKSSELGRVESEELKRVSVVDESQQVQINLSDYKVPWYNLLWAVQRRGLVSSWRDSRTNYGRISTLLFLGVLFGLIFLQIDDSDYAGVISKLSAIFSVLGFGGMLQNQLALPNIIVERAVYYRERASDSYPSWMYSVSIGIVEIPWVAISIMCFVVPFYFLVGYNNDASDFFKFYLSVFMLAITLSSFGQWAGATFPSFVTAIQASGMLVTFWFLFGGIFIHPADIPKGWLWFYYLNPIPKALIACALPQFQCHMDNPYDPSSGCPTIQVADLDGNLNTWTVHAYMNNQLDAGYDTYGKQIAFIACFYVFFRLLIAMSLKYINHLKR